MVLTRATPVGSRKIRLFAANKRTWPGPVDMNNVSELGKYSKNPRLKP